MDTLLKSLTKDELISVFDRLCDFSSGFTYIASCSTDRLIYTNSHLATHLTSFINLTENDTLFSLLNRASGIDKKVYDWLIKQIIPRDNVRNKRYTYSIELPWILYNEGICWCSYKFSSFSRCIEGTTKYYIIGRLGMPTGYFINKLKRIEISSGEICIKNIGESEWYSIEALKLSKIEMSTLILTNAGLPIEQIATLTNRSSDAIKSIKQRIINKLDVNNMIQANTYTNC